MESTLVNWEALDFLIISFAKSEHLIEDATPVSSPSSSSYQYRLLIRQIRRNLEAGDVDSTFNILRGQAPVVLEDHRILFRLQKQKFIELLRRGTVKDRDSAIQCLRLALAPCALDAYPEAYEEFKHVLLALIFDKDDQSSPVVNEWSERRRFDLAGLLSSILRVHFQAYDPIFLMTLRYLVSIHRLFCRRQGISSPITDLTERLLFEDRDPAATPQESLYGAPPFDEVDIQALAHAVELTRQGAVDSLRFAKGDLFQAFQNELCRTQLDFSVVDELVREYCIYRGIADSAAIYSLADLVNTSSRDCISPPSDDEASINDVGSEGFQEVNVNPVSIREDDSGLYCPSERMTNHEDCSSSTVDHLQSCSRKLRRSRFDASRGKRRKRWRGRADLLEVNDDRSNRNTVTSALNAFGHTCLEDKVSRNHSSFQNISIKDVRKYELVLEMKELASKGMVAKVVEEVNSMDPEFFNLNPTLLFQLKQVEFFDLVNSGNVQLALKVACTYLGPLASNNQDLMKSLKETLLILLKHNEEALRETIPLSSLANNLQVALGRRFGIEEPQLMKIMRATLHTHNEWFKLQMCKDRFEEFLKIDRLKEVNVQVKCDTWAEGHADNSVLIFSQNTSSSNSKIPEDNSSPSHASSYESLYDENAIIKVMEFLALPRADAIHLLMQYNGNAETVIQQIFS